MRLLDSIDVFCERNDILRRSGTTSHWFTTSPEQEATGLQRADRVMAISRPDARAIQQLGAREVCLTGTVMRVRTTPRREDSTPAVLLVGSGNPGNRRALAVFLKDVWPGLRRHAALWVAGELGAFVTRKDVRVCGEKADLADLYERCWLCINPDLGGTGLPIKSLEALHHGCPLVTTPAGARGLLPTFDRAMVVADTAAFEGELVRLLRDGEARGMLSRAALAGAERFQEQVGAGLREALA